MKRKVTKTIRVGNVFIGGRNPITIQSMTNTNTEDIEATVSQIKELEHEGCEIVRISLPTIKAAEAIKQIKSRVSIPIVADVHFDYKIALTALENGIDKLRINPGNIGSIDKIKQVVESAKAHHVPIRIGVNSGSLEEDILKKYGEPSAKALVESALRHVAILEDLDFYDICISIKSSDVGISIKAYELLSKKVDYPLHIGITEAGTLYAGSIKSAVGIGAILSKGIGDTIRVSLTDNPVQEVKCAKEILKALRLREFGIELISCPTCSRTKINLIKIAKEIEKKCSKINKNIKVAVMGCEVNGPGEARDADIGIAGGNGCGILFKKGKVIKRVEEKKLIEVLMAELENL